jgi:hypothetical protein
MNIDLTDDEIRVLINACTLVIQRDALGDFVQSDDLGDFVDLAVLELVRSRLAEIELGGAS